MKKMLRAIALFTALLTAALALACGAADSGTASTPAPTGGNGGQATEVPDKMAFMPPITWNTLEAEEMIKLTVLGKEKTFTASELFALDRGQLVAYDTEESATRGGDPIYFVGVYMKGLIYAANNEVDLNNIKSVKLIGVDGSETVLDGELASSILLESVLALQRGAIVTTAEKGCMMVLKSGTLQDRNNKIYRGIAEIIVG